MDKNIITYIKIYRIIDFKFLYEEILVCDLM